MNVIDLITALNQQDIRLWLEDGQLRFSAPKGGLSEDTRQLIRDNKPGIIEFLRETGAQQALPIEPVDPGSLQPLSNAQERIWFLSQLDPGNPSFHLPMILSLQGPLDTSLLERVLNIIIERHAILRTAYIQDARGTWQKILPAKTLALNIEYSDQHLTDEQIRIMADTQTRLPFSLESGNVTHNLLVAMPGQSYLLFLTIHHIASDGWSLSIIGNEIAQLYRAFLTDTGNPLPALPLQYADFAVWQRRSLERPPLQKQLEFWRTRLAGHENLDFPADFPRTSEPDHAGASLRFRLNMHDSAALYRLAQQHNTTIFTVLLGLFAVLLFRYSRQNSFCIGTPVAGRPHSGCEQLAGCFLNLLALPMELEAGSSFTRILEYMRNTTQEAFANQDIPFEEVVKAIVTTRNMDVTPLFQVMFGWQNAPTTVVSDIGGIRIEPIVKTKNAALYDLSLNMREWQGELIGEFDYRSALFRSDTMQSLSDNFVRLIHGVIGNPDMTIGQLPLISEEDRRRQLHDWNNTRRDRHLPATLHTLVEQQVARTPDQVAVCFRSQHLSYRDLNLRANRLARHLQQRGMQEGSIVGIFLERSLELPVTLLAILKAGCCYLPLDLDYPHSRLETIVADARLQWLVTSRELEQWPGAGILNTVYVEDHAQWQSNPADNLPLPAADRPLFNVIYTSGSTGKPKGVMVSHAALLNRLSWMQETFPLANSDRVLHKTPYNFDVSVWEIFWPLMAGAQLFIAEPQGHRNPSYLHELILRAGITIVHFVPSMLGAFLDENRHRQPLPDLRYLFCSGESLGLNLASHFYRQHPCCQLVNLYGPTEAAIDATFHICTPDTASIPIGKPISNTQIHIVDESLQLLPTGAIGEIMIGGDGLAEGYLNNETMTASAFINNPFSPGSRLYHSGDLGRYDHDGQLHFIGRNDHQIKVRGLRVELEEIESLLKRHPAILEAIVTAHGNSSNVLIIAYYQSHGAIETPALRNYLAQFLPGFMIPNAFVMIEEWPRHSSGKINRKALPALQQHPAHTAPYVPPRDDMETTIANIWKELLNIGDVGIHDNFFELGGHSLLATLAITRVQDAYGVKILLGDIFREPTIAVFARAVKTAREKHQQQAQDHSRP